MPNDDNPITFFAYTNYRNEHRHFGILKKDRRYHMYILGKTGMGKTTLMGNLIRSDLELGNGLAVFDPHGDLALRTLRHVPQARMKDVIFFDPSIESQALRFNLLSTKEDYENHIVCSALISMFKKTFSEFWGPRLEHILRNTLLTLLTIPDTTIQDIPKILTNATWRKSVTSDLDDPYLIEFWEKEFGKHPARLQQEAISPILNKVGQYIAHPLVRNIVGYPEDILNFDEIVNEGKILIVNLPKGQIGEDAVLMLGTALLTRIQLAVLKRSAILEQQRRDFYLYMDEFHEFATESFVSLLPQARKFHLDLILAHQYLEQLSHDIQSAIMGNVGTKIVFQLGFQDAKIMAEEFAHKFSIDDFVNLPQFNMYIKLMINGIVSEGFSAILK